ncbi:MAG: tRNA (adenosine(37)-N6)-dimethylallyltransferase MiaA [Bacilli bacterium]|nr:tRNA (adenosine(37)-N6)-dimethylallyltransferase MiaA [Bacilli bacterium]
MSRVIVITGPTAVGKTKLSIELAKKLNGEIINADAMQVYKGLNIGTAKVTEKEKENIPHHLFDIKEVEEEYSIYNYQKDCRKVIDDILRRNKIPILVGGTGLYIKAALYDYKLSEEKTNNTYDNLKTEEIYKELLKLDKDINIDKNNRRRLIRALNYYKENNTSISNNKTNKLLYDTIFIGLTTDREILYKKINQRVDNMIENGLLEEVKYYYDKNIKTKPLINGIGYKELYNYFDGLCSKEEAVEKIKQNSRHYAKRQYTFLNHQLNVVWFETDYNNFNNTIEKVSSYIKNK